MEIRECFLVLGLEPVKDERTIKNAYREKLAATNPEDDPEGFMRLRNAYEQACRYVNSQEEPQSNQTDTTPSGIWVAKAAKIYSRLATRCQVDSWRELFSDDIFESLEEEENCRDKFLRFLMDHFRLPTEVWKLLDGKLNLARDAGILRERFPADFINFVLSRCERGEDICFEMLQGPEDGDYDLFLNYYDKCWRAMQDNNEKEVAKYLEEAEGLHISYPPMDVCKGYLYLMQCKTDEAKDFMRSLCSNYPQDDMIVFHTAEILWKNEDRREAAELFIQLKKRNEKHYMANYRLTEWYYETGEYKLAKKCAENVLSAGTEDSFLEILTKVNAKLEKDMHKKWLLEKDWESALELCWCYLQDGAISKGISLAEKIVPCVTEEKEAEYTGLLAKLYIEAGEYETAIEKADEWEEKLKEKLSKDEPEEEKEKDKDRIRQAYMIRMQALRYLGYVDGENFAKAIEQIEKVETNTPKDIGLLLEKAQILMEMEEFEKSLEITSKLVEEYQVFAACACAMEVYKRQWHAGGVVQNARICIQNFPNFVRAYELLGRVYLDLDEKEELQKLLEEAKANQIESPYLTAYQYHMGHQIPKEETLYKKLDEFQAQYQDKVEKGQMAFYEQGLLLINEYVNWYPCAFMLRRRAAYFKAAQKYEEALADYEKALADEPANPAIYANMGIIYRIIGDYEKALLNMKRAILHGEEEEWANSLLIQTARIYMCLNENEKALSYFERYEAVECDDTDHLRNMAECLGRLGRAEEAREKLLKYYTKSQGSLYEGYYSNLYEIYRLADQPGQQKALLESWRKIKQIGKKIFGFSGAGTDKDVIDYYYCSGWQAMLECDEKKAMSELVEHYKLYQKHDKSLEGLMDLVFAAILFGEEKQGRRYAQKIKQYLKEQGFKAVSDYYDAPKIEATYRFLAEYYDADIETLQEILNQAQCCPNCTFCIQPFCKELHGMQMLLELKRGRIKECMDELYEDWDTKKISDYAQVLRIVLENKYPEEKRNV